MNARFLKPDKQQRRRKRSINSAAGVGDALEAGAAPFERMADRKNASGLLHCLS
jgi:hypothetical protein